ncbi:hypothetical protein ACQ4PT_039677 [Festuca glaucescens]
MATTAEGRRRRKNRSKKDRRDAGATTTVLDLPDHLFEHILLRLGPSPCLVRAAAACRRWCRVVFDAGFLARIRSAHPHAIRVGDYHNHIFNDEDEPPVFVPVPASPAAPSAVDVRRFVLDFLPDVGKDYYWEMADSRGSLLLLSTWTKHYCHELLVCEPLTRRRQGILMPPDFLFSLGMFLVDCDDADSQLGMSNFRIIGAVDETLACVFSPGSDGGWRLVRSQATSGANFPWSVDEDNLVGRVNGCVYWGIEEGDGTEVLVLNETTAEYSMAKFPEEIWGSYVRWKCGSWIIGGEDGVLRIVRLLGNDLKIFVQRHSCSQPNDHDDKPWILEKELVGLAEATVGLPGREENFFEHGARIVAANAEYILLSPMLAPGEDPWVFSVEVDTMRMERGHERNKYEGVGYPFELPWPPVLPNHVRRARR